MRDNPTPRSLRHRRQCALAAGLVFLASALPLFGLELERIIPLAPSGTKGATDMPEQFVLNPLRNRLYCLGSAGWAVVIDCAENRIVGDMPIPPPAGSPPLWSATCRKAYFLTEMGIVVVDGTADTIRATIPVPEPWWNAAFDDTNRCLLVTIPESSRILVFCGNGDTLKRQLRTTRQPYRVVWNPVSGRYNTLEAKGNDTCYMTVFDAASGAVLDSFSLEAVGVGVLAYTPTSNKVYAGTESTVVVIDGLSNRILKRLPFPADHLVWNQPGNKLYCWYKDTVRVISCATDSLLKVFALPESISSGFRASCTTLSNRVWLSTINATYVVDAALDSIIAVVTPHGWTYNKEQGCVYGVDYARSFLVAIDEPSCQARDTIGTGFEVTDVCCNPKLNKLYARDLVWDGANSGVSSITVVDQATGQMLKRLYTGKSTVYCFLMVLDPGQDKLYCPNSDDATISVIDCHGDSIIKTIPVAPEPYYLAVNTTDNKLYCTHDDEPARVSVIDFKSDSVVAVVPLRVPWPRRVWWHAGVNKAYVSHYGGMVTVIDGQTNQVIREIGPYPGGLTCDTRHNRLYTPCGGGLGSGLYALDAVGDTVVDSFPQLNLLGWVVWNERSDKVYFFGRTPPPELRWAIGVVDCASDSFLRVLPRPPGYTMSNRWPPASHPTEPRAYFYAHSDTAPEPRGGAGIWTIECDSDTITGFARFAPECYATSRVCVDGTRNLVFANGLSRIYVMKDQLPGVAESPGSSHEPRLSLSRNPMLDRLTIRLDLPVAQSAELKIHDRAGRLVRALASARPATQHIWRWDGKDEQGRRTPAGVYFLNLVSGNQRLSQKIVRLR